MAYRAEALTRQNQYLLIATTGGLNQQVGEVILLGDAYVDAVVGTLVLCSVKDVDLTLKGIHLDPSIYLVDDERKSPGAQTEKVLNPASVEPDQMIMLQNEKKNIDGGDENNGGSRTLSLTEGISTNQVDAVSNSMASMGLDESMPAHQGIT